MNNFSSLVQELKENIVNSNNIGIVGHVSPDGDCLGSGLSLYQGIKKIKENVSLVKNDDVPKYLDVLDGLEEMVTYSGDMNFDLLLIVDCSSIDRIGKAEKIFKLAKKTACIDHHNTNQYFADINIVDSLSSSTCQLVYEILYEMEIAYDKPMANNTLVGILTDTNRFMYQDASPRTLEIASKLLAFGIDKDKIMQGLYQSNTLESLKLTAHVINHAKFYYGNKLAISTTLNEDLVKLGASIEDLEGKIDLIRDIDTVELAITIREEKDSYKVSLRSKNCIDVADLAMEFGGGGHTRAAGFSYIGKLDELRKKLMERLEEIDWSNI